MPISQQQYTEMMYKLDNSNRLRGCNPLVNEGVERESDLHDQIIKFCAEQPQPWVCLHNRMDRKQHSNLGMPDFVIATHDGRTLYVEAKRRGGKCTPAQNAMLHWLERNKQIVAVVYSLEDFIAVSKT